VDYFSVLLGKRTVFMPKASDRMAIHFQVMKWWEISHSWLTNVWITGKHNGTFQDHGSVFSSYIFQHLPPPELRTSHCHVVWNYKHQCQVTAIVNSPSRLNTHIMHNNSKMAYFKCHHHLTVSTTAIVHTIYMFQSNISVIIQIKLSHGNMFQL